MTPRLAWHERCNILVQHEPEPRLGSDPKGAIIMPRYYVVPFDCDWAIVQRGARRPCSIHGDREAALGAARQLARREGGVVVPPAPPQ